MRQNLPSCYRANFLPSQKAGGILPFRAYLWPLAGLALHILHPHLKSGKLVRAPNPDSSSSSSWFPACLPPILWPSQSLLPKITQCLGVLCPGRCCCLVWGQRASPEDTGGGLVGLLASRPKTGNGWQIGRVRTAWRATDGGGGRLQEEELWVCGGGLSPH